LLLCGFSGRASNSSSQPRIDFSTYLGGEGGDEASAVATAADGTIFITGTTSSSTVAPGGGSEPGDDVASARDVFVARIDGDAGRVVYFTVIGGSDWDDPFAIAVDESGQAVVAGGTLSPDFPTSEGAFQPAHATAPCSNDCGYDAFLFRLAPDGGLEFSTYVGGEKGDLAFGVALGEGGDVYVSGHTRSRHFPTTPGAVQERKGGGADLFLARFRGNTLRAGTYIGGSDDDMYGRVGVPADGRPVVVGRSSSRNFPLRRPLDKTLGGGNDGVISRMGRRGQTLLYSTYFGGSSNERPNSVSVRADGRAVVGGLTSSDDLRVKNAAQRRFGGGCCDGFLAELGPLGQRNLHTTYIGGSAYDEVTGVAAGRGLSLVSGVTESVDLPIVAPASEQPDRTACITTNLACIDGFTATIRLDAFLHSSYLGGGRYDDLEGAAFDKSGRWIVVGATESPDYPTLRPVQPTLKGASDAVVTRIESGG